jgi:hypothetical protein
MTFLRSRIPQQKAISHTPECTPADTVARRLLLVIGRIVRRQPIAPRRIISDNIDISLR